MLLECQQHPDYHEAITTLLDLADEYGKHSKRLASGGTGTVKETRSGLAEAEADLKVCMTDCIVVEGRLTSNLMIDTHRALRQRNLD